jgi:hypothetical protein
VVRAEDDRHAVVGHRSDKVLHVGDVLVGNFNSTGHGKLHNLTKGESLWVHVHIVDRSFAEASSFAS